MCNSPKDDVKKHLFNIPADEWTTILAFNGAFDLPKEVRSYRVTVNKGPAGTRVKWRRFSFGTAPFSKGSFVGSTDFNIYPTDKLLRVQVWSAVAIQLKAVREPTIPAPNPAPRRRKKTVRR